MPLIVYILGRLDLLGHDIGQVTAHAHSVNISNNPIHNVFKNMGQSLVMAK